MKRTLYCLFLSLIFFVLCSQAFSLGTRTISFAGPKDDRLIVAEIFYPTRDESSDKEPKQSVWERKPFTKNAPFQKGKKLPLIIFSHGFQGDRFNNSWISEWLVEAGYIVANIDHPLNNSYEHSDRFIYTSMWQRPLDMTALLDYLLADETLGPLIDKDRIAAGGFSLGGLTCLWLAGIVADPNAFKDTMNSYARFDVWAAPVLQSVLAVDWSKAGLSYRDPRVKAVFSIAPDLGKGFEPAGIQQAAIPALIIVGDEDRITPPNENASYYAAHLKDPQLQIIKGASHFAFMNKCTAFGRQILPRNLCEPGSLDQDITHQETMKKILAFLKEHL